MAWHLWSVVHPNERRILMHGREAFKVAHRGIAGERSLDYTVERGFSELIGDGEDLQYPAVGVLGRMRTPTRTDGSVTLLGVDPIDKTSITKNSVTADASAYVLSLTSCFIVT